MPHPVTSTPTAPSSEDTADAPARRVTANDTPFPTRPLARQQFAVITVLAAGIGMALLVATAGLGRVDRAVAARELPEPIVSGGLGTIELGKPGCATGCRHYAAGTFQCSAHSTGVAQGEEFDERPDPLRPPPRPRSA